MNREILHRFFAGETSMQEGLSIKAWLEASEENRCIFQRERRLYDALMLHDDRQPVVHSFKLPVRRLMKEVMKVAAIILLSLTFYTLYQNQLWEKENMAMHTVTVPAGQRTHLTLPDGSKVWLNARTQLCYPVNFNQKERKVILEGEAYFDVARNEKKPFIVQTEQYQVEVLGTQFNVEAYSESDEFETTLMQGSVKVSSQQNPGQTLTLQPNQKAYVKDGALTAVMVDDFSSYRWKEGLICFKNTPFQEVMHEFEKYYGIRVVIENQDVIPYSYNGKFRQSDGVDYALSVLQRDIHFTYNKDNESEIIYIQ